jgi:2-polyprenyl-3-methyl-5-hydroxy-6-metoxy-1,4-benzoquinol methylase
MNGMEPFFPLHAYVCERCWLVQLEAFHAPGQIFDEYAYFSSYSTSWLTHAQRFAEAATKRFNLNAKSLVVEAASNDGYLLQYFRRVGVPVLGIEPATNVAQVALDKGIPTTSAFMGVALAKQLLAEGQQADLLIGINVFAHVPDLHDFVGGMERLLKPRGVLALEFPHLLRLIEGCQFDTIYHEHFSYFSLMAAQAILERHGLTVFDVEEQPTHGGSIRIYAAHTNQAAARMTPAPKHMIDVERAYGLDKAATYAAFAEATHSVKRSLLRFLIDAREGGKQVVGYGAPAKGNTLLNYCGIRGDLLPYTVDISPHKQGLYLPGTHIPILAPEHIAQTRPDYVLILPWNLKEEITAKMAHIREWGGRFVVPLPSVEVLA